MTFKVSITRKAEKELDKIQDKFARKILKEVLLLSEDPLPRNHKKLSGKIEYRIRIGVYRAVYLINKKSKEITIIKVAHRKEVYK